MKKRESEFMLLDVSNSFTKAAFSSPRRVGRVIRIPTQKFDGNIVRRLLRQQPARMLVISSVVPAKNASLLLAAGARPVIWLTSESRLNLRFQYPAPQTIGADRLANAVAVNALYRPPAIVIDFGTAVTFDVISADGTYLGGVIAPGLEAMTSFLYHRTALLPRISLREPRRAVGKSTREAMLAGAVFGYRGLVREILRQIIRERFSRKRVQVVATGGYARLVARSLPEIDSVRENLTLEGLRVVGLLYRDGKCSA